MGFLIYLFPALSLLQGPTTGQALRMWNEYDHLCWCVHSLEEDTDMEQTEATIHDE